MKQTACANKFKIIFNIYLFTSAIYISFTNTKKLISRMQAVNLHTQKFIFL